MPEVYTKYKIKTTTEGRLPTRLAQEGTAGI